MYSLKEISAQTNKPLRTIQNWFKGVKEDDLNPSTGAKLYKEETVLEVLKDKKITLNNAETAEEIKGAPNGTQETRQGAPLRANNENLMFSLLEKQISFYQAQLEEKDKQISNLSASLSKSNELLSQEQQLNLLNIQRIEELKNQLQISAPKEDTVLEKKNVSEDDEPPAQEEKKSFFQKFFGL